MKAKKTKATFDWRDWVQEWNRLFVTERANWLQKSGLGHTGWANESFNGLPRAIQEAFADHVRIVRSVYGYK